MTKLVGISSSWMSSTDRIDTKFVEIGVKFTKNMASSHCTQLEGLRPGLYLLCLDAPYCHLSITNSCIVFLVTVLLESSFLSIISNKSTKNRHKLARFTDLLHFAKIVLKILIV